jgi:hypothetical protein
MQAELESKAFCTCHRIFCNFRNQQLERKAHIASSYPVLWHSKHISHCVILKLRFYQYTIRPPQSTITVQAVGQSPLCYNKKKICQLVTSSLSAAQDIYRKLVFPFPAVDIK